MRPIRTPRAALEILSQQARDLERASSTITATLRLAQRALDTAYRAVDDIEHGEDRAAAKVLADSRLLDESLAAFAGVWPARSAHRESLGWGAKRYQAALAECVRRHTVTVRRDGRLLRPADDLRERVAHHADQIESALVGLEGLSAGQIRQLTGMASRDWAPAIAECQRRGTVAWERDPRGWLVWRLARDGEL